MSALASEKWWESKTEFSSEYIKVNLESNRKDAEIYILKALLNKTTDQAEIAKLKWLLSDISARSTLPNRSERWLTTEEWQWVQKLLLRERETEKVNETLQSDIEKLRSHIVSVRLREGVPWDVASAGFEKFLTASWPEFLMMHAGDLSRLAFSSGILTKENTKTAYDAIIVNPNLEREFSRVLKGLNENGITVSQIIALKAEKPAELTRKIMQMATIWEEIDTAEWGEQKKIEPWKIGGTEDEDIEYQQQVLISSLIVHIFKKATVVPQNDSSWKPKEGTDTWKPENRGLLTKLVRQKSINIPKDDNPVKYEKYVDYMPIWEAMELLIATSLSGSKKNIITGIVGSIGKNFGKDASTWEHLQGFVSMNIADLEKEQVTAETAMLEFLAEKYPNPDKSIDLWKVAQALAILENSEIDENRKNMEALLWKKGITLSLKEWEIINNILIGGDKNIKVEKDEGLETQETRKKQKIPDFICSLITKTPESKEKTSGYEWLTVETWPIQADFRKKWTEHATISDMILFQDLQDMYKDNPTDEEGQLIILWSIVMWMKEKNVKWADEIGKKVTEVIAKKIIGKWSEFLGKLSAGTIDLSDDMEASLYYTTRKKQIDPSLSWTFGKVLWAWKDAAKWVLDWSNDWSWWIWVLLITLTGSRMYNAFTWRKNNWITPRKNWLGRLNNRIIGRYGLWKSLQQIQIENWSAPEQSNNQDLKSQLDTMKQDAKAEMALEWLPDKLAEWSEIEDGFDSTKARRVKRILDDIETIKSHSQYNTDPDFKAKIDNIIKIANPTYLAEQNIEIASEIQKIETEIGNLKTGKIKGRK